MVVNQRNGLWALSEQPESAVSLELDAHRCAATFLPQHLN